MKTCVFENLNPSMLPFCPLAFYSMTHWCIIIVVVNIGVEYGFLICVLNHVKRIKYTKTIIIDKTR